MEWILTSFILTAAVIALRYILRGRLSLRLQYALWALVLVRLLIPVSFGVSGMSVMNAAPEALRRSDGYIRQSESYTLRVDGDVVYRGKEPPSDEKFEELTGGGTYSVSGMTRRLSLYPVWFAGIACVGVCLLASNLRFAAKLRRSRLRLDIALCRLPVYVSDAIETPCLFGLFRPAVYVTPEAAEDENVLRRAIVHETTHYRHGDHIWAILRGVCLALHWFDPLVWWAAFLSRRDSELACDEAAIKTLGEDERGAYGRTLIDMTCKKRGALLVAATTMTGGKRCIRERVTLIAKKPKTAAYALVLLLLAAAAAAGCTFTGADKSAVSPSVPSAPSGVLI